MMAMLQQNSVLLESIRRPIPGDSPATVDVAKLVQHAKKGARQLCPNLWVPSATTTRGFQILTPHVWVDRLKEAPFKVVSGEVYSAAGSFKDVIERSYGFSDSGVIMFDACTDAFITALQCCSAGAFGEAHLSEEQWQLLFSCVENILLQAALAKGGASGLASICGKIRQQKNDALLDFPKLLDDVKDASKRKSMSERRDKRPRSPEEKGKNSFRSKGNHYYSN
jgi:hypothetical protein